MKQSLRKPSTVGGAAGSAPGTAADQELAIGIDLGGTNTKAAVVDHRGNILARREWLTNPGRGPDAVIEEIAAVVEQLIDEMKDDAADPARLRIKGIGIGCPGPLDLVQGRVIRAANLPGWVDVPLRDMLSARMSLPVTLENDANAAAFGEYWASHRHSPASDMVFLTLGTGVGAGAIVNGELLHGHFGNAAEIGHTIVAVDGRVCPCGQRGCLETYASASSVVRRVMEAIENGEPCAMADRVRMNERIEASEIADAAAKDDPVCKRVWNDACCFLAMTCANIQHTLNPAAIVFGGGMAKAGALLLASVQAHFDRLTWSLHDDRPNLRLSSLGSDAGVIGAAALVWSMKTEG